ncbi:unnamed protein product [Protopolystoma xenopodis]|uniref:TFIIS N-terminal domain-containing protein n=1 Tax=Protopolystoma xenopodis TaxID=117903 RepID=A0A448XKX8_9PLAT|nr:unnamed protein product [Protopolystoma xenopodis]
MQRYTNIWLPEDPDLALKYLKRLKGMNMTLDILTKTGVGIIINKIRKISENPEITSLGKNLIKQWKKLVPVSGSKRSPEDAGNDAVSDDGSGAPSNSKKSRKTSVVQEEPHTKPRDFPLNLFPSKQHATSDSTRLKAREMIQSALSSGGESIFHNYLAYCYESYVPKAIFLTSDTPAGGYEAEYLAIRVECAIFELFGHSGDPKYKQRVRTRVMNLRDSNNPNLRINVLMGHVSPEKLASMTSEVDFLKFIAEYLSIQFVFPQIFIYLTKNLHLSFFQFL